MIVKTISITVSGLVQGVWFRKHTCDAALNAGLAGIVMNKPDGSVYIEATGSEPQLNQLIEWCHTGSPKSKVMSVKVGNFDEVKLFEGFVIAG